MSVSKLKAVLAALLVLGFVAAGATALTRGTAVAEGDEPPVAKAPAPPAAGDKPPAAGERPKAPRKREQDKGGFADGVKGGKDAARLSDGDRRRLEKAGPATTKEFVAALRKRFSAESAGELRRFIDPRYLKEHKLQDGKFPIRTVVTDVIYDNRASDDPQTLVAVAKTEAAAKEAFVFRLTVYEGKVYLQPLAPPDPATRSFAPWILRMKL
jgi:hypothetical protein